MILLSSNERVEVRDAFGDNALPVALDHDFLLYTTRGPVAGERKRVPQDFLTSVEDGRLARECAAMRKVSQHRFLVMEGDFTYGTDGRVRDGRYTWHYTKEAIRTLLRDLRYIEGVDIEFSRDIPDTVAVVLGVQRWFDSAHKAIRVRPSLQGMFDKPTVSERYLYWLQGIPHITETRARQIASVFTTPYSLYEADLDCLRDVHPLTHKVPRNEITFAELVWEFLHGKG